jgi:NTP pyrophosphatase (non-canonical NTP hydrolase)
MDIKELLEFIEKEDRRLKEHYKLDEEKRTLARTVKLMEELGELCDDVLSYGSMQRGDKLEKHDRENVQEEFADVIFTAMLLAKSMGIDVWKGMERKMEKIKKRSY